MDLRHFIKGGRSGDPIVCIGDTADDPQCQENPRGVPPQDGPLSSGAGAEV